MWSRKPNNADPTRQAGKILTRKLTFKKRQFSRTDSFQKVPVPDGVRKVTFATKWCSRRLPLPTYCAGKSREKVNLTLNSGFLKTVVFHCAHKSARKMASRKKHFFEISVFLEVQYGFSIDWCRREKMTCGFSRQVAFRDKWSFQFAHNTPRVEDTR